MAVDIPVPHTSKITWKSDEAVWVAQWPLTTEKLAAGTALVVIEKKIWQMQVITGS